MSNFKKGSNVLLKEDTASFSGFIIPKGTKGIVLDDDHQDWPFVEFNINPNDSLHDAGGLGCVGKCWSVNIDSLELFNYESSNRFKLKQAIKETGISSRKLSHFAVGNESFFYNQTGPARFKEYGDISSSKLDSMLVLLEVAKINLNAKITQDAFDEREKLDLAAKTVDENNVPVVDEIYTNTKGEEISLPDQKPHDMSNWSEIGNSDQEDYLRYVGQLQSQAIEKRNYRLRNWLIALIGFSLLLALYFFTK